MIIAADFLLRLIISLLGLTGFFVARHIYNSKKKAKPLVCPVKFDCNAVVHSDYSKFLGAPVERLGMIYYSLIFVAYFLLMFVPTELPIWLVYGIALYAFSAVVFSLYLVLVQAFVLHKGCSWCAFSAVISLFIFIFIAAVHDFSALLSAF